MNVTFYNYLLTELSYTLEYNILGNWKFCLQPFKKNKTNNSHYISDTFLPLAHLMIPANSKVRKDKFFSSRSGMV